MSKNRKPQGARPSHPGKPAGGRSSGSQLRLYGRHAVMAALANPERRPIRLYVTHEAAAGLQVPPRLELLYGSNDDLKRLVPEGAPHQGMVLEVAPLESPHLTDLLATAGESRGPILVLDQVTDPHNIGAMLRSAAAFGAIALVTQDRHAPPETGALAKAASGCLELVPWVRVVNLARALDEIAEAGFWRIGLDGRATRTLAAVLGNCRPCLVMGAEGEGLRPNVVEHCDELAKLPISPQVESLNVSNAAAIALYAAAARD
jgi:23S rRNA (guanosine2251-2'-O)-methyltransferase